jgi:phenylalanyl-tRNA synthetase beta subunit
MTTHPRGLALLINNRRFGYMSERIGTEIDGVNLENLLKQLGYQVEQKRELKAQVRKSPKISWVIASETFYLWR